MSDTKIDIFEKNAEFFERFCNSQDTTARDRYNRIRDTIYGIQVKIDGIVTNGALTEAALINKSVGSGKWMREGAYGLGGTRVLEILKNPNECQPCGFYYGTNLSSGGAFFIDHLFSQTRAGFRISNTPYSDKFYMQGSAGGDSRLFRPAVELYHNKNTTTDKSGVLHAGTRTPLDTLNTSDITDTVIDSEDSVPSNSAVKRALFGMGQEWKDVTESRSLASVYTNDTNKTIEVAVGTGSGLDPSIHAEVDGITVGMTRDTFSSDADYNRTCVCFSVPPGSTYSVSKISTQGVSSIKFWSELR